MYVCTHTLPRGGAKRSEANCCPDRLPRVVPHAAAAQKTNRDTPGYRNAIVSLAIKLLPSETNLPRWKPVLSLSLSFFLFVKLNSDLHRPETLFQPTPRGANDIRGASRDYICHYSCSRLLLSFLLSNESLSPSISPLRNEIF